MSLRHSGILSKVLSQKENVKSETCWLGREHIGCCQDMNKEIIALKKCPQVGLQVMTFLGSFTISSLALVPGFLLR